MKTGKELYEYYHKYVLDHIGEDSEEMQYATFINGLPQDCCNPVPYSEVYSKLEQAEREGKKLSTHVINDKTDMDWGYEIILV